MNKIIWADTTSSKSQRSDKNRNTRQEKQSFELLVRIVQETPKTLQNIVITFGCLPEVEGKSLLLKTPCTSETEPRGCGAGTD